MTKLTPIARLASAAAALLIATSAPAYAEQAPPGAAPAETLPQAKRPAKSGRLSIGGVEYYYEIRGQGEPLILLHGGLGSGEMFGPVIPALAERHQVIAVDLRVVDADTWVAPEGFSATLPRPDGEAVPVRRADGIHLCPEGQILLAQGLLEVVAAEQCRAADG